MKWPIDGQFNALANRELMRSGEEHTCAADVYGLAGTVVIFTPEGSIINGKVHRKANSLAPLLRGWQSDVQAKTHKLSVKWERFERHPSPVLGRLEVPFIREEIAMLGMTGSQQP